jgi:hypothetical protein
MKEVSDPLSLSARAYVASYVDSYPSKASFRLSPQDDPHEVSTSFNFRHSRELIMCGLLAGNARPESMFTAYMSEQLVRLGLEPLLKDSGFYVSLAPQAFEHGNCQKGVDLIISDEDKVVYLGIDVKLREKRRYPESDGYGFCQPLCCPYIYLSLGNWRADMKEDPEVSILKWISNYTIPKINRTGKIPRLDNFRSYLVKRIEKSLDGYCNRLEKGETYPRQDYLSSHFDDLNILIDKLYIMHTLFMDLSFSR